MKKYLLWIIIVAWLVIWLTQLAKAGTFASCSISATGGTADYWSYFSTFSSGDEVTMTAFWSWIISTYERTNLKTREVVSTSSTYAYNGTTSAPISVKLTNVSADTCTVRRFLLIMD